MATRNLSCTKDARLLEPDLGAGACDHLPVGTTGGLTYRSLVQFAMDWSGVTQITKAELKIRTSDFYHVGPDNITVETYRITASWSEGSASHPATSGNAVTYPGPATGTSGGTVSSGTSSNSWKTIDVTAIVNRWAPSSVLQSNGSPGPGDPNYGIRLMSANEASDTATEFWSRETGSDPYIVLTYSTNAVPGAPTSIALDGFGTGSTIPAPDTNWGLTFAVVDPNGDTIQAVDWQIDATSGDGVVPDWASLAASGTFNYPDYTVLSPSGHISKTISATLTRGQWYALRVRASDGTGYGSWSSPYYFKANSLPTVGTRTPGSAALAPVSNLGALALWTSGGTDAQARLKAVYTDPDGTGLTKCRFRVYNDSAGSPGSLRWDSGDVVIGIASGKTVVCDVGVNVYQEDDTTVTVAVAGTGTAGFVNGTVYHWSVEFWDAATESTGESSKTTFKVRWAQGLYESNPGASSSAWNWANAAVAANTRSAFIFRSADTSGGDAATGKTAWKASLGEVAAGDAWMQVLVRLSTDVSGTQPDLADMQFSYLGSATLPDRWTLSGSGTLALDPNVRRFGSQSLKVTGMSANRYLYPYRKTSGDDIPVSGNTKYVWSVFVKTSGVLSANVRLRVRTAGGGATIAEATTSEGQTLDSSSFPDGWQRLVLRFTTPGGTTAVRPSIDYLGTTSTDAFWVDACKFEEGTVATSWTPGFVGEPVVMDSNGLQIDGLAGGIFRLRGITGGTRDVVDLGNRGLLFTDFEVWSPSAETLRIGDGLAQQTLEIDAASSGSDGGRIGLLGAGSNADGYLTNVSGRIVPSVGFSPQLVGGGGTSFPGSPVTGDRYWRSDHRAEFFWDGTRWVTTQLYRADDGIGLTAGATIPMTATTSGGHRRIMLHIPFGTDLWLEDLVTNFYVSGGTALSASHKWVISSTLNPGATGIADQSISSGASSEWRTMTTAYDTAVGAYYEIDLLYTKTGTPGNLYSYTTAYYRVIAT